jgi:hypothetical protein
VATSSSRHEIGSKYHQAAARNAATSVSQDERGWSLLVAITPKHEVAKKQSNGQPDRQQEVVLPRGTSTGGGRKLLVGGVAARRWVGRG